MVDKMLDIKEYVPVPICMYITRERLGGVRIHSESADRKLLRSVNAAQKAREGTSGQSSREANDTNGIMFKQQCDAARGSIGEGNGFSKVEI